MQKSSICLILAFSCLGVGTWATDGVKGGHRPRFPSTNQHLHANLSQSGLCYKTVPYSNVLALNASGSPYNTIPQPPHGNPPNNEWITILDCCDGYRRNVTSGLCEPQCDRGCFGGRCTGPNVCSCQPGWRPEDGVCMPVCEHGCKENAYCYTPNVCVCKLGYDEVRDVCRPICPDGCHRGSECVAPRVCGCQPGYVLDEHKKCVATCEGGCAHGVCSSPGVCACNEGYENPPGDGESCAPHCSDGCHDGDCVAPNVCRCRPGYTKDRNGRCVPSGRPSLPQCMHGYTYDPNTGRCVPSDRPSSPQCMHGYTYDPNTGRCVPATSDSSQPGGCRYDCGQNAVCVGQDRCECQPGFVLDVVARACVAATVAANVSSQCTPPCGPHGRCFPSSNACICNVGFRNDPDTGRCVAEGRNDADAPCHRCLNGDCTGPNQCTCHHGYTHDLQDPTRTTCVPVCAGGCPNGVCTSPNRCICNLGYRKEIGKGWQRCVREQ